jgi:hypothetical protein
MFRKCFKILLNQHKKRQARRQLRWQNFLRQRGIGIHTRILEIKERACPFANHVQCVVQVRLRVRGKNVSHWVQTILAAHGTLQKGDLVHIRYSPAHFRRVLVLK